MNNDDSTIKDILNVTVSNGISLTSSILNGFVIPMILGTLNYGYYKIFTLYASYTVLFHFGFNDGLLLSYGGKHYDDIDKYSFRSNSFFFIIFQLAIAIVIALMSLFTNNYFYKILFLLLGINDFTQNLLEYYQNISQTFMRFTEYSIINTIQSIALIVSVLSILVYCKLYNLHDMGFIPYVFIIISINAALVIWYFYDYRAITFGHHLPLIRKIKSFKRYFISGFYMTFGYGISVLIFNLDSQFVVKFFSVKTYGIYAFAYSMFSAGLTILTSASVVLIPHLKQHSKKYILNKFSRNVSYMNLLVYLAISGYFFLKIIIYKFIFEYHNSLIYFRLLLPGMVITCCVSTVISSYYYVLKHGKFYFFLSLIILIIAFIMDLFTYLIFRSPVELALSSTMSLLVWYLLSYHFIVKWYRVQWIKNLIYVLIMMILFFIISNINDVFIGFSFYILSYIFVSIALFRHNIKYILTKLLDRI